jgi:hypothetical protein
VLHVKVPRTPKSGAAAQRKSRMYYTERQVSVSIAMGQGASYELIHHVTRREVLTPGYSGALN